MNLRTENGLRDWSARRRVALFSPSNLKVGQGGRLGEAGCYQLAVSESPTGVAPGRRLGRTDSDARRRPEPTQILTRMDLDGLGRMTRILLGQTPSHGPDPCAPAPSTLLPIDSDVATRTP